MSKIKSLPFIILVISAVLVAAMVLSKKPPSKKPNIVKARVVQTVIAESQDLQFKVSTQGVVKAKTESNIVAQVSGVIQYISANFVSGGYFKKGDILLRIDDTDYQIAIAQSQARLDGDNARLDQEKARVEQAEKEWALTGRSKKDAPALALRIPYLIEAEAKVRGSEADLRNARLRLERATIKAPYDGIIAKKQADLGQFVNVGGTLGQAFAVDYSEVRLPLSDKDVAYLNLPRPGKLNQQFPSVTLSAKVANKSYQWQGKIIRTEGLVDEKTRVHFAVAQIEDPYGIHKDSKNPALSVGTFVRATILGKWAHAVIRLPREVLKGTNTVLVKDSADKLRVRHVEIVRAENEWIYIRSGIESGEKVITTSLEARIEGMALKEDGPIKAKKQQNQTQIATEGQKQQSTSSAPISANVAQ